MQRLDELATLIVLAEPDELASIRELRQLVGALLDEDHALFDDPERASLAGCQSTLDQIAEGAADDAEAALASVVSAVSDLQRQIAARGRARLTQAKASGAQPTAEATPAETPAPTSPAPKAEEPDAEAIGSGELVLPAEVDDELFQEFLSSQNMVLEEIEQDILSLEQGETERLQELRRRIHTTKGEAGVLGLDGLAQVCHAIEDYLDTDRDPRDKADLLLDTKDWLSGSLEAYRRYRLPTPDAAQVVARIQSKLASRGAPAAPEPSAPTPAAPRPPELAAPPPAESELAPTTPATSAASRVTPSGSHSEREEGLGGSALPDDEEGREVISAFCEESLSELDAVERLVLDLSRQEPPPPDKLARIANVFERLKTSSAFLDLYELTTLTEATEAMLQKLREATAAVREAGIDLVPDVIAISRLLLEQVSASARGVSPAQRAPGVEPLVECLAAVVQGDPNFVPERPAVAPGDRLGEILVRNRILSSKQLSTALEGQAATGRPLGEQLISSGAVGAREVVRALRAQSRSDDVRREMVAKRDVVKVDLDRIDQLVELIGELVTVESMVANAPEVAGHASVRLGKQLGQLTKITRDLQDVGMQMRMVPLRGLFQKMRRLVRDLCRRSGKDVQVTLSGETTEMDRSMVEQVADPLIHLIRNAVDHGIEDQESRKQAGKPPSGVIHLSASHEGGGIVVEVHDDGNGLNLPRILAKARAKGLVRDDEALSDAEVERLIFEPGFSTAESVTDISGRGVGMDVVRQHVERLRGRIQVSSRPGEGSSFKLALPLTLAIIDGMIVGCGRERYILPTLSIVETLQLSPEMRYTLAGEQELLRVRGEVLPLIRLGRLLQIDAGASDAGGGLVVIVETSRRKVGLLVDDVLTQQQVVIKRLGAALDRNRLFTGSAILSDGRVSLILNVEELDELAGLGAIRSSWSSAHESN